MLYVSIHSFPPLQLLNPSANPSQIWQKDKSFREIKLYENKCTGREERPYYCVSPPFPLGETGCNESSTFISHPKAHIGSGKAQQTPSITRTIPHWNTGCFMSRVWKQHFRVVWRMGGSRLAPHPANKKLRAKQSDAVPAFTPAHCPAEIPTCFAPGVHTAPSTPPPQPRPQPFLT